jgi:CRP-like cAMP-binding protein
VANAAPVALFPLKSVKGLRPKHSVVKRRSKIRAIFLAANSRGVEMNIETLRGFSLFDGMSDEELERKVLLFEPIRRMAGERVTQEDDFGYSLFLVISGRLSVDHGGEVVAEIGTGDHFGEVSLVTGEKRNATVTALETCELAKIMTWDFDTLVAEHPVLAARIKAIADQRVND